MPAPEHARLRFEDVSFEFRLGTRPSDFPWFDLASPDHDILAEKKDVFSRFPEEEIIVSQEEAAAPLLEETYERVGTTHLSPDREGMRKLSTIWEPDTILLKRSTDKEPIMVAGSLCFVSSFDPQEKIGRGITEIHEPVPTLNPLLGANIEKYMSRLRPDRTYERLAWGLAATTEKNMHPSHDHKRMTKDTSLEEMTVRWEYQGFQTLPESNGVLFMLHLVTQPLTEAISEPSQRQAFVHQLKTMPDNIAKYKDILPVKARLIKELQKRS